MCQSGERRGLPVSPDWTLPGARLMSETLTTSSSEGTVGLRRTVSFGGLLFISLGL